MFIVLDVTFKNVVFVLWEFLVLIIEPQLINKFSYNF